MGTYRREGDSFDRSREWQDLSRSRKSLAFSFLVVLGGVAALIGFGFAVLIQRLLF